MNNNGWQKFITFINQYEVGKSFSRQQFLAWAIENNLALGSVDGYRNQLVRTGYFKIYKRGTYELVNKILVGTTTTEVQLLLGGDRLKYLENIVARKEKAKHDEERRIKFEALLATNNRILDDIYSRACLDCKGSFPRPVMQLSYRQAPRWDRTLFKLIRSDTHKLLEEIELCDLVCMNCHITRNAVKILA
jgi:hypothetical protein